MSAFTGIRRGTHVFVSMYSLTRVAIEWGHSLFSLPKLLLFPLGINHRLLLALYLPLVAGSMLLLYAVRLHHLPDSNQIVLYSTAMVLLPPTSFDYTLVQLYGAWAILTVLAVRSHRHRQRTPGLTPALVLLALAFTPGNLFTIAGHDFNGQSKALALLALLALAARTPFVPVPLLAPPAETRP